MKKHPNASGSALPIRGPIGNQAIAIARSLRHAEHGTDRALLERVAAGLRALEYSNEFHPQRDAQHTAPSPGAMPGISLLPQRGAGRGRAHR